MASEPETTGQPRPLRRYLRTQWQRAFGVNISRIDDLTFVGGQFRPEQWPRIRLLGIRAVLSLQAEYEDTFVGTPPERTMRLEVPDFHPPTFAQLQEAVRFITDAHADSLPVFIHCHAGVGRAPLTTAAYLISRGATAKAALATILQARPIIELNNRQLALLLEWEQKQQTLL
jgi:protein-tyrosine phosphatase